MGEQEPGTRASALARTVLIATRALSGWLPLALLVAVSPGVFVWGIAHRDQLGQHFALNRLAGEARTQLLMQVAGSVLLIGSVYGVALWRAGARHGGWDPAAPGRLNRALAFLIALPLSLAFAVPGLETAHPFILLSIALVAAAAAGVSASSRGPALARWRWAEGAPASAVAVLAVVALAALYAWRVIDLELAQHRGLRTGAYDLGIYTNILWQSLHGNWLGCSFIKGGTHASAHYDPILILLSPAMLLHRGAETLIVLQGAWVASAALPIYLLGARYGGRVFGVALAAVFLAHPAVHGPSLFDFHSMSLSIPFVVWAVYFVDRGAAVPYWIAIALLLLCREDMSVAAGCVGLFAIVAHRRVRTGVATIAIAAVYLFVVKRFAMPDPALLMADSAQSYEYGSYFSGLSGSGGAGGIAATVAANPVYVITHLLIEKRVLYLVTLLAPLAFLPFLAGRRWVLLGHGMIFALLTSRDATFTIGFHYAATAVPGLFALAPYGARRVAEWLERANRTPREETFAGLSAALLTGGVLISIGFGALVPNASFRAGFYPLVRELGPDEARQWDAFVELTRDIPPDAPLSASGFALPHFAARQRLYHLPDLNDAEWVVARTSRLPGHESGRIRALRRDPAWELAGEREGTVVFRRRGPRRSARAPGGAG